MTNSNIDYLCLKCYLKLFNIVADEMQGIY